MGLSFKVVTTSKSATEVNDRIEEFLVTTEKKLSTCQKKRLWNMS